MLSKKYAGFVLLKTKVHREPRASLEVVFCCILPVLSPIPSLFIACLVFCLCSNRNCCFCLGFPPVFTFVVTMCNKSHMCQNGQVFSYVRINFDMILIQSVNFYKKQTNPLISSVLFSQYSLSFTWAAVMWNNYLTPAAGSRHLSHSSFYMYLYPQFKIQERNQIFQEAVSQWNTD